MKLSLLAVVAAVGCGCGGNTPGNSANPYGSDGRMNSERDARVREATKKLETGSGAKVAEAGNDFGFRLLKSLYKAKPEDNLFISPLSMQIALSMTMNGAAKGTYKAMSDTLGYDKLKLDEVNGGLQSLGTVLKEVDPQVTTSMANSLWVRELTELNPEFIKRSQDVFGATVSAPISLDGINEWVKTNTQERIPKLFEELPPNVVSVLVNTVFFKGDWKEQFTPDNTRERPFFGLDGKEVKAQLMSRGGMVPFGKIPDLDCQAISLAYGRGRIVMDVWLPEKGADFSKFVAKFNEKRYAKWLAALAPTELTEIALPKFKSESNLTLNETLKAMGMEVAFDAAKADFTEMRKSGELWIALVKHRTFVQVDEKGTVAAAASGVAMVEKGMPEPKTFICDRPFVYVIRDSEAKTVLFVGILVRP